MGESGEAATVLAPNPSRSCRAHDESHLAQFASFGTRNEVPKPRPPVLHLRSAMLPHPLLYHRVEVHLQMFHHRFSDRFQAVDAAAAVAADHEATLVALVLCAAVVSSDVDDIVLALVDAPAIVVPPAALPMLVAAVQAAGAAAGAAIAAAIATAFAAS